LDIGKQGLRLVLLLMQLKRGGSSTLPSFGADSGGVLAAKVATCKQSIAVLREVLEDLQDCSRPSSLASSSMEAS